MLGDRVDDSATELDDAEPVRHERGIGIEPDAQRCALALHRVSEPISEMSRPAHAYQDTSRPRRAVPKPDKKRPPGGGLFIPRRRLGLS
jgi:hypothetical protein